MAMTAAYGKMSASDHSRQLRKAVIASAIGTAIEWCDSFATAFMPDHTGKDISMGYDD